MASYPVLLVPLQRTVQEVSGHLLILIQPLDDKGFKPPAKGQLSWDTLPTVASTGHPTHCLLGLLLHCCWGIGFNPSSQDMATCILPLAFILQWVSVTSVWVEFL